MAQQLKRKSIYVATGGGDAGRAKGMSGALGGERGGPDGPPGGEGMFAFVQEPGAQVPEPSTKRGRPGTEGAEDDLLVKFCIPSNLVGSIIGKRGATVNDIMRQSQTKVHVSKPHEVFPGTRERVCTILGDGGGMKSILVGLHLILSKIRAEDTHNEFFFRLIMPAQVCGAVIGRQGANIRAIIEETGAELKVSDQKEVLHSAPFRLITIFGSVDQQLRTVNLCVQRAMEESDYLERIRGFNGTSGSAHQPAADYMQPPPGNFRGPQQFVHGKFIVFSFYGKQEKATTSVTLLLVLLCLRPAPPRLAFERLC